jgi:hypothetical protein
LTSGRSPPRWRTKGDYEHRWLINPETGEIAYRTPDTGIDGQAPADLDELDLICIGPLPSGIWHQDRSSAWESGMPFCVEMHSLAAVLSAADRMS